MRTEPSLADISRLHNPILRGWMAYSGRFSLPGSMQVRRRETPLVRAASVDIFYTWLCYRLDL
ncbi:hypothetical protein [Accumulibacter sp.]|uniref:hypothetical protein n=1 Tax=Accumulibacter sp. TaxID=2053492 RepID=UPI00338DC82F